MYSPEFMKYLIKYQAQECSETTSKKVKTFSFGFSHRQLASVLLVNKK